MPEPFEIAQRAAAERAATEARRATLARGEHVWLQLDYLGGPRWVPGILTGWRRNADGEWRGHVVVVMLNWDRHEQRWTSGSWEEWSRADRIRPAETVPPDGSDLWHV